MSDAFDEVLELAEKKNMCAVTWDEYGRFELEKKISGLKTIVFLLKKNELLIKYDTSEFKYVVLLLITMYKHLYIGSDSLVVCSENTQKKIKHSDNLEELWDDLFDLIESNLEISVCLNEEELSYFFQNTYYIVSKYRHDDFYLNKIQ